MKSRTWCHVPEAATEVVLNKKTFLKISQYSQENSCIGVTGLQACNVIKKDSHKFWRISANFYFWCLLILMSFNISHFVSSHQGVINVNFSKYFACLLKGWSLGSSSWGLKNNFLGYFDNHDLIQYAYLYATLWIRYNWNWTQSLEPKMILLL